MKNKILKISALVIALVLVLGGAFILYRHLKAKNTPEVVIPSLFEDLLSSITASPEEDKTYDDEPVPDFTVYDADGNPVKLSDFRGSPVVLNFWASWCDPCKEELPAFNALYEELNGEVVFLMINVTDGTQETKETAQQFLSEQSFTFPVYFDTDLDAVVEYGAATLPSTYFIDTEGYGQAYAIGSIDRATLEVGISYIRTES